MSLIFSLKFSHRSHGLRGKASVDALRFVPQERHNCIPTQERGNDSPNPSRFDMLMAGMFDVTKRWGSYLTTSLQNYLRLT